MIQLMKDCFCSCSMLQSESPYYRILALYSPGEKSNHSTFSIPDWDRSMQRLPKTHRLWNTGLGCTVILSAPNFVITVPPTRCSLGNDCQSYYLTGSIYNLDPSADTFRDHPEATLFIVENSIGYQIDYYPPLSTDNLGGAECGTYGADYSALHICIKQSGHDLLAGKFLYKLGRR